MDGVETVLICCWRILMSSTGVFTRLPRETVRKDSQLGFPLLYRRFVREVLELTS
jgi:hypothetical protein